AVTQRHHVLNALAGGNTRDEQDPKRPRKAARRRPEAVEIDRMAQHAKLVAGHPVVLVEELGEAFARANDEIGAGKLGWLQAAAQREPRAHEQMDTAPL